MLIVELLVGISFVLLIAVVILVGLIYRALNQSNLKSPKLKPIKSTVANKSKNVVDEQAQTDEVQMRLRKQADDALKLTSSFQKFVPKQFIDHFTKSGLDALELGHAIEAEVSIMFCDIRGFTTLAENMSPKELMKFLNSYFYRMNDPIHENNGFIDKFIGDAIMALFDRKSDKEGGYTYDSIKAAVELYKALELYNTQRAKSGYDPIKIAIGLHSGNVVIGTVGSDDRMDTTVIGDAVNVAERIEKLSTLYEVDILVSDELLESAQRRGKFTHRFVDRLRVRGRKQSIDVYEVIEHLSRREKDKKLEVAHLIEKGVMHRIKLEWEESIRCFEEAITTSPGDRLAFYHLKRSVELKNAHSEMHNDENLGIFL